MIRFEKSTISQNKGHTKLITFQSSRRTNNMIKTTNKI